MHYIKSTTLIPQFRLFCRRDRSPSVKSLGHLFSLVCYCVAVFLRAAFRSVGLRACTSVWGAASVNRGRPSRRQAPATLPSARRARTRFLRLGSAPVVFTL
ncbi:hypothetical protein EVAR_103661_1 [Eumeta japonica]|uniref:Transmembrane protein n=1 Tax=Eumeta variegata TaxID=151549 RepID=A0A4C1Z4H6_EUMVA|nr:hypothetical protein EVAR_103661_1 [Eumeta japonica]